LETVDESEPTESALIARAQRGETAAYEELVRRHRPDAYRAALSVTGDADDAEDATQDACIKAYRALGTFDPAAPFRPWLVRIAANEARNRRRSAQRRAQLAERAAVDAASSISHALEPEAVALERERREALRSALDGLRPEDRQMVRSRYFAALSDAELAARLGIPRGTVKSRLSRAMARLRTALVAASLVLLLLLAAVLAASREAREAIADRLGLRGVGITHVPAIPTPAPAPQQVLPTTAAGWHLGTPVTPDEARTANGGRLFQPSLSDLGPPQAAYVLDDQRSRLTTLVYTPPPGLMPGVSGPVLFAQLTGSLEPAVVGKELGPESRLTAVAVGGNRGFWLEGHPHLVVFRDATGNYREDTIRLAGNTLLWEREDVVLRLEGVASLEQALRVAASVRP
jgi:RNA polymerase sigma-70 factor (ECF subfamily)